MGRLTVDIMLIRRQAGEEFCFVQKKSEEHKIIEIGAHVSKKMRLQYYFKKSL